jgi:hypothetical protein
MALRGNGGWGMGIIHRLFAVYSPYVVLFSTNASVYRAIVMYTWLHSSVCCGVPCSTNASIQQSTTIPKKVLLKTLNIPGAQNKKKHYFSPLSTVFKGTKWLLFCLNLIQNDPSRPVPPRSYRLFTVCCSIFN